MKAPFIVAEIGANHLGSFDRAQDLIDAAASAGADAIKLQTWTPGTMCRDLRYTLESGPWKGRRLHDLYREAHTSWDWHQPLFDHAKALGLVAFSSVFDAGALSFLEYLQCPIYKIASFELVDLPLIQKVAQTGKPMMLSTGMASFEEISAAWATAIQAGCRDLTLLKCTSAYPADAAQANLAAMVRMQEAFGGDTTAVGLSDHSKGAAVAVAATALGATVIEKHLTMSRADGGLDAGFSMEPVEFAEMVSACRKAKRALGEATFGTVPGESTELRRGLYASKAIKTGDKITEANTYTARPAKGASPRILYGNMVATKDMAEDEPIIAVAPANTTFDVCQSNLRDPH